LKRTPIRFEEILRPILADECSQEDFKSFTQRWNQYARYHSGKDVDELRHQLLNCPDTALKEFMYDSLGSKVDTLSLTDLFKQLEKLAVVEVDEDTKQTVVPQAEIVPLYGQNGGQEGAAQKKVIPKTFVKCEELSCQFNMVLEDEFSARRVLENHRIVAHKRQEQIHQQELCGRKGGRRRGAKNKTVPDRNGGGLDYGQVQQMQETKVRENQGICKYGGENGHGKSPSQESLESRECLESRDCDVIQCNKKWHFPDYCTEKKPQEVPDDSKKEMRCGERAQSYKMVMRWT
jgi:hypothetical protein